MDYQGVTSEIRKIAKDLTASYTYKTYRMSAHADRVSIIFKWEKSLPSNAISLTHLLRETDLFEKEVIADMRKVGLYPPFKMNFLNGEFVASAVGGNVGKLKFKGNWGDMDEFHDWIESGGFVSEDPARIKRNEEKLLEILLGD